MNITPDNRAATPYDVPNPPPFVNKSKIAPVQPKSKEKLGLIKRIITSVENALRSLLLQFLRFFQAPKINKKIKHLVTQSTGLDKCVNFDKIDKDSLRKEDIVKLLDDIENKLLKLQKSQEAIKEIFRLNLSSKQKKILTGLTVKTDKNIEYLNRFKEDLNARQTSINDQKAAVVHMKKPAALSKAVLGKRTRPKTSTFQANANQ